MTPAFTTRRRVEEFDRLVEGTSTTALRDAQVDQFLAIVAQLRSTPQVEPRPAFVSDLRSRLMAEADSALAPSAAAVNDRLSIAPRRTPRERRLAVVAGGFAIVGATTSMAVAAQSALPGDVLYPLKRAIENVQASFSHDDSSRGAVLLENASGRLDEVDALAQNDGPVDAQAITETLAAFTQQTSEASDLLVADFQSSGREGSIAELRDFTAAAMRTLTSLESMVPDAAHAALVTAARILARINLTIGQLCPTCGGTPLGELPAFLTAPLADLIDGVTTSSYTVPDKEERATRHPRAAHHPAPPRTRGAQDTAPAEEPEEASEPVDRSDSPMVSDRHDGEDDPDLDLPGLLGGGRSSTTASPDSILPGTDLGPLDDLYGDLLGGHSR